MIIDANLLFSSAQAVTVTADSTNIVDLGVARDLGIDGGNDLNLLVLVGTTFTGGTSINVQFMGAPDNGSGAPGTYSTLAESGAVPVASLTAGASLLRIEWPAVPAGYATPRFVKFTYTVVGTMTAGTITATITPDRQANVAYAPGVTAFL